MRDGEEPLANIVFQGLFFPTYFDSTSQEVEEDKRQTVLQTRERGRSSKSYH